jgi:DNA-binding winged helix-turn-helix (wHTH) protein
MHEDGYAFGPYRLDLDRHCILRNDRLHCWRSKIHFLLLKTLIDAEPEVVTFDQFLTDVWPGKDRTHHNVGEHMRGLKGCIVGCADHIKNHPGIGYSFDRAPKRPLFEPGAGVDLQAARLFTVAHAEWTRRTRDSVGRALDLFQELADLQLNNPLAHLGMAECLALLGHVGFGVFPTREAIPKARAAVNRALSLATDDTTRAAVLSTSGLISMAFDWKLSIAESEFSQALSLNPNYGPAHHWRALLYLFTDRWPEAIDSIRTAGELALNAPMVHGTSGWLLYFMDRAREAIPINEETVRLHPDFAAGYVMLGMAYEALERYQEAIDTFETSFALDPRPSGVTQNRPVMVT